MSKRGAGAMGIKRQTPARDKCMPVELTEETVRSRLSLIIKSNVEQLEKLLKKNDECDPFPEITDRNQHRFLIAYVACGQIAFALNSLGMTRFSHHQWMTGYRKPDAAEAYRVAFHRAERIVDTVITDEIHRRAVEGWMEPVFYQGKQTGAVRKYSDPLLSLEAKKRMPEYRDKWTADVNLTADQDLSQALAEGRARAAARDSLRTITMPVIAGVADKAESESQES